MRKLLPLILLLFLACNTQQQVASWNNSGIKLQADSLGLHDAGVEKMIAPYKTKLDSQMNKVLVKLEADMRKELPEGALGNFLCDAMLQHAKEKNSEVAFCIFNSGGIRVPVWYAGDITVRNVFELMPFDNSVVLLKLKGNKCKELMEAVAQAGGAPVAGVQMQIDGEGHATDVRIDSQPIDENKMYWMVTSDYLAGGNDGATALLNPAERINTGVLVRDVLLKQLEAAGKSNKSLLVKTDGRIRRK